MKKINIEFTENYFHKEIEYSFNIEAIQMKDF